MPTFENYVRFHGEFGAQALIEMLERLEGGRVRLGDPLEQRWQLLMAGNDNGTGEESK